MCCVATPHHFADKVLRQGLADPLNLRDLVREVAGDVASELDFDRAEFVGRDFQLPDLGRREADVLCRVPLRRSGQAPLVCVLVEHQSSPDPDMPLRQAARILVPGGRLLLLDLAPHGEDWVRDKLEHVHMGFRGDDLAARVAAAGFEKIESDEMRKGPGQPFRILIVTGVRAASGGSSTKDAGGGPGGKRRRRPSSRKGGRP